MSEEQKKQLHQLLWSIADTLRGKMHADEFRDYILGFIFYKYLSEKMSIYANEILKEDNIKYQDIQEETKKGKELIEAIKEEAILTLGYFLKPSELFSQVAQKGNSKAKDEKAEIKSNFIIEELHLILKHIEQSTMGTESQDDFDHLFEDLDLNSTKLGKTVTDRNALISRVLAHLDGIDFELENSNADVLGDAYEYLIGQFASGAGKKAGEFYTPQQVSIILAKLVTSNKKKLKTVYDPTCGSGSLLLRVSKEAEVSNFYGQELNRTTYNLARMNMILHGIHYQKFDIKQEDTLERPQHINMRFEAIVANPPFSAQWSASPLFLNDDRFSRYGKLAPGSKADFAFVQHMIHHLAENGTMAIVLPHGVLFRGAAEGHIRRFLIEERNYLDAVIGLPANIFYGTSIPTCILVFKICRENPKDVLFIDASNGFEKVKNQNVLRASDIDKIISTYRNRKPEPKYSRVATLQVIAENDYNLNIPRYVDTFEKEKIIDLKIVTTYLLDYDTHSKEIDKNIAKICYELDLPIPIGNNIFLLEQYKKGVMQKIFNREIRFKDDKGNDFPEWEEKRLGEIGSIVSGLTYNPIDIDETGVLVLRSSNVHNRVITLEDNVFVKTELFNPVKENDVLICVRNGSKRLIGKNAIVKKEHQGLAFGAFMSVYRSKYNSFLFHWFDTVEYYRIVNENLGATINSINGSDLKKFKVPLPSEEEQQKIASFLSSLDKKIESINTQIEKAKVWKKGLLQQMFI